jgi:hypothetical protein
VSCADEARLAGSEGRSKSETDCPPFKRLVPFEYECNELMRLGCRGFFCVPSLEAKPLPPSDNLCDDNAEVGELLLDDGLAALGGCGNAPTLMVFRNGRWALRAGDGGLEPAGVVGMLDAEPTCFCFGIPLDFGVGRPEDTLRGVTTTGGAS